MLEATSTSYSTMRGGWISATRMARRFLHSPTRAAPSQPPYEEPDSQCPLWLTTGRVVHHWHTRTKTGRVRALNDAAPEAFVQFAPEDASRLGILDGDLVEVESRRGKLRLPACIG